MWKRVIIATIYVSDQDRALQFYTDKLGLEKSGDNRVPEGRFLTVAPADQSVQILLWPGGPAQPHPGDDTEQGMALGPIFLESDDLRKEFEVLRDRGVEFVQSEPEDYAYGVRVTALDPDGNRIELRQLPNRGPGTDS
jgi:catechol 2,3-dioxygenase-like lactoylglutathione lyase family enzyme